MFVSVQLLSTAQPPLWYCVPSEKERFVELGRFVRVPIRNKIDVAIVVEVVFSVPPIRGTIRSILSVEQFPDDKHYLCFVKRLADYYQVDYLSLVKRLRRFMREKPQEKISQTVHSDNLVQHVQPKLTDEQACAAIGIIDAVDTERFTTILLRGVTGSGKTEVYKAAIMHTLTKGKTVLLLLPEVTLAVSFAARLQKELGTKTVIRSFHSGTGQAEKRLLWQEACTGKPLLIVGVHLPPLLPLANIGLVIVDEEHESGFQEKKHPYINSKEAMLLRGSISGFPILLGSATPSLQTIYNQKIRGWPEFRLTERFAGSYPIIKTVLIPERRKARKQFWITQELAAAILDRLHKKEQILIFVNRRGYSFFVQCESCGFVVTCTDCSVSLTLHEGDLLLCHYCGKSQIMPKSCSECKQGGAFLKKGLGTQQVAAILQKMFPLARIARADLDATVQRVKWQSTMALFEKGDIDILVGTQMITKGYDFAKVTLVGIIWADLALHYPQYNAVEKIVQQLIQVSGRAGRRLTMSEVIVQHMEQHWIFSQLNEFAYDSLCAKDLAMRAELKYPPYRRFISVELRSENELVVNEESLIMMGFLREYIVAQGFTERIQLLGPTKPPVYKIKGVYARMIYMKADSIHEAISAYKGAINAYPFTAMVYFLPNAS